MTHGQPWRSIVFSKNRASSFEFAGGAVAPLRGGGNQSRQVIDEIFLCNLPLQGSTFAVLRSLITGKNLLGGVISGKREIICHGLHDLIMYEALTANLK